MTSDWQPIDTAPKDGTWVLLCGGSEGNSWDGGSYPTVLSGQWTTNLNGKVVKGHWQSAWYDGGYLGGYLGPTHWMPLPEMPKVIELVESALIDFAAHQQAMQALQARVNELEQEAETRSDILVGKVAANDRLQTEVELLTIEKTAAVNRACQCACHRLPEHSKLQDALEAIQWHQQQLAERQAELVEAKRETRRAKSDRTQIDDSAVELFEENVRLQAEVERLQADRDSWQKQAEIQAGSLRTSQAEVERLKKDKQRLILYNASWESTCQWIPGE